MRKFCQNLQNAQLCRPKTGILSAFLPSAAGQNSDTFPVLHTVERGGSLQGREKIGDVPLPSCRFASSHRPQGDGFSSGGKASGIAIRRPLGGAGCERSEQTEGVSSLQTSSPSPSRLTPCHLSQRERPWQKDEVCGDCQGLSLWESCHRR